MFRLIYRLGRMRNVCRRVCGLSNRINPSSHAGRGNFKLHLCCDVIQEKTVADLFEIWHTIAQPSNVLGSTTMVADNSQMIRLKKGDVRDQTRKIKQ